MEIIHRLIANLGMLMKNETNIILNFSVPSTSIDYANSNRFVNDQNEKHFQTTLYIELKQTSF